MNLSSHTASSAVVSATSAVAPAIPFQVAIAVEGTGKWSVQNRLVRPSTRLQYLLCSFFSPSRTRPRERGSHERQVCASAPERPRRCYRRLGPEFSLVVQPSRSPFALATAIRSGRCLVVTLGQRHCAIRFDRWLALGQRHRSFAARSSSSATAGPSPRAISRQSCLSTGRSKGCLLRGLVRPSVWVDRRTNHQGSGIQGRVGQGAGP